MTFLTIVFKNLMRRPTRSLLTMAGISVGIGAVVSLTSISNGFIASWDRIYNARGTDMIVMKVVTQSPIPPTFDAAVAADLARMPHVASVSGLLAELMGVEDAPTLLVSGWQAGTFAWDHLRIVEGRLPADDAEAVAIVGSVAMELLDKKLGGTLQIETTSLKICGVFESDAMAENGSIVMTLTQMQRVTEQPGRINYVDMNLDDAVTKAEVEDLRTTIAARWPGHKAFTAGQVAEANPGIKVARGMSWATSLIAIVVGAIGVMNTVLMSVFERMKEFGILLAIGWRRGRIVRMVLFESMLLSFVGGLFGILIGIVGIKSLEATPLLHGKIQGELTLTLVALALTIAVALGVLGGIYPAVRGSHMRPSEALRYE